MPEERPRIILEKSSTVRRRYQRSDKRFKFTAQQLKRIEREEQLEKRAKDIREKEKRRVANKKKKLEQDTKAREEARKQGLPDPNAPKLPSSQPLLSKFLGFASRPPTEDPPNKEPSPEETASEHGSPTSPKPTGSTLNTHEDQHMECDSVGGDTEAESDLFDDLDEELEQEISALDDTIALNDQNPEDSGLNTSKRSLDISKEAPNADDDDEFSDFSAFDEQGPVYDGSNKASDADRHQIKSPGTLGLTSDQGHWTPRCPEHDGPKTGQGNTDISKQPFNTERSDDEFSDCSAFYDDLDENSALEISAVDEKVAMNQQLPEHTGFNISTESMDISKETLDTEDGDDEFSDCSAFYDDDVLQEVDAAVVTQTSQQETFASRQKPTPITRTFLQPPNNDPKTDTRAIPSLNSSFRDETADYLDDVFARGCGDSFGELLELGSKPR